MNKNLKKAKLFQNMVQILSIFLGVFGIICLLSIPGGMELAEEIGRAYNPINAVIDFVLVIVCFSACYCLNKLNDYMEKNIQIELKKTKNN